MAHDHPQDEASTEHERRRGRTGRGMSRRRVLQCVSVGATGLAGAAGTAGAARGVPPFFGACESGWQQAPADYPVIDLRSPEPFTAGDFPEGASEFLVYVHGWLEKFARGGRNQGYTLETALQQNGYSQPTVAAIWNSNDPAWPVAKRRADIAGQRLARFIVGYLERYPATTIKTVDHSLGTRVILEALATLGGDSVLDNVSTIGGAVDADTVCSGTRYGDGIEASVNELYNYHSRNDDIVCETYASYEGTAGIGCAGADCGSTPSNYADVDVTDSVNAHCNYGKPDVGCVPEIVANF